MLFNGGLLSFEAILDNIRLRSWLWMCSKVVGFNAPSLSGLIPHCYVLRINIDEDLSR